MSGKYTLQGIHTCILPTGHLPGCLLAPKASIQAQGFLKIENIWTSLLKIYPILFWSILRNLKPTSGVAQEVTQGHQRVLKRRKLKKKNERKAIFLYNSFLSSFTQLVNLEVSTCWKQEVNQFFHHKALPSSYGPESLLPFSTQPLGRTIFFSIFSSTFFLLCGVTTDF